MTRSQSEALAALNPRRPEMTLCEVCGAYSRRSCEMEDEIGTCPWEDAGGWDEPDPDRLREDRDDRAREGAPK